MNKKQLEEILEKEFIPKYLQYTDKRSAYIDINQILKLNLPSELIDYAIEFIKSKGINLDKRNIESIDSYKKIVENKQLSLKENKELINEYVKTHDKKIREKLILGNMNRVKYQAFTYSKLYGMDLDDCEQQMYQIMIEVIDNWKEDTKSDLSTLLVNAFKSKFEAKEFKGKYLSDMKDMLYDVDNDGIVREEEVFKELYNEYKGKIIDNYFSRLSDREKIVLTKRFGLEDGRCQTLKEIGKCFDVDRGRIREIEAKALWKLRRMMRDDGLNLSDIGDIDVKGK